MGRIMLSQLQSFLGRSVLRGGGCFGTVTNRTISSAAAAKTTSAPRGGDVSPPKSTPPIPPVTPHPEQPVKTPESRPATQDSSGSVYDVVIVGGGVTGSSLLYELSHFTDLPRIALFERRKDFATIASGPNNNSQTIHCGDIETNYTLQKAKSVKRQADMLRNYATKLPEGVQSKCVIRMPKMVLGVGSEECEMLENRYQVFKDVFPNMEFVGSHQILEMEPCVVMETTHSQRKEEVGAIAIKNEHSAVDYYNLTKSFLNLATHSPSANKKVDIHLRTEVKKIRRREDGLYELNIGRYQTESIASTVRAKFVVVSACGYSLLMAQALGYGLQYSCLPVAGSFYFSTRPFLNGKVYTVQDPLLPFAAVHGDPDVVAGGATRFGPTALPLPLLERYNPSSFRDYLKVVRPDMKLLAVYLNLLKSPTIRNYVLRNVLFEIPIVNKKLFLRDVRKICPGIQEEHLQYATGFGGVRPQLIDKQQMKLLLGEGKIEGSNIIFNITPSPGGTTCLGTAEKDMRTICKTLGANIDESSLRRTLLEGQYPVEG